MRLIPHPHVHYVVVSSDMLILFKNALLYHLQFYYSYRAGTYQPYIRTHTHMHTHIHTHTHTHIKHTLTLSYIHYHFMNWSAIRLSNKHPFCDTISVITCITIIIRQPSPHHIILISIQIIFFHYFLRIITLILLIVQPIFLFFYLLFVYITCTTKVIAWV